MKEASLVSRQHFSSLGEHLQVGHGNRYEIKLHVGGAEIMHNGRHEICEALGETL